MIVGVAIIHEGVIWSMEPPNRHHHVIRAIVNATHVEHVDGEQGFIDDQKHFLNRKQALVHALQCGQVKDPTQIRANQLFSEDLW